MPGPIRNRVIRKIKNSHTSLQVKIHGKKAIMPAGYLYPEVCRNISTFNDPLLNLAWQTRLTKKSKITVVDIGAAIGDTALLLKQNLPPQSTEIICIEGDGGFYSYLSQNLAGMEDCKTFLASLSSAEEEIPSLIHHHTSSLRAGGPQKIKAITLDTLWQNSFNQPVDILKTDTDGFDGKVLAGAMIMLHQYNPSVIFEFHPLLYRACNNSFNEPFEVLKKTGYPSLLWYDKFGNFIAEKNTNDSGFINVKTEESLAGGTEKDIHYDIIAPGTLLKAVTQILYKLPAKSMKKYPY